MSHMWHRARRLSLTPRAYSRPVVGIMRTVAPLVFVLLVAAILMLLLGVFVAEAKILLLVAIVLATAAGVAHLSRHDT